MWKSIGLKNKNNVLNESIKESILELGIHKRPVRFTYRGKRKISFLRHDHESCFEPDPNFEFKIKSVEPRRKQQKTNSKGINISNLIKVDTKPENRFMFPTIYFANARSMNNKKEELEQEIKDAHADIAIITETWLHSDIASNLFPSKDTNSSEMTEKRDKEEVSQFTFVRIYRSSVGYVAKKTRSKPYGSL